MTDLSVRLARDVSIINSAINGIISDEYSCCKADEVIAAEEYSLNAGGKRIRPVLCLEFYKLFGGKNDVSRIAACLELVHTFSLIHDDMPEMDNDELRRGQPTAHIKFGAATALLAGDGLAILPYKVISNEALENNLSSDTAVALMGLLAGASGNEGMISGQMLDIQGETRALSESEILQTYSLKTGALLKCSCLFGAILAGADRDMLAQTEIYAENIGLAFQLVDDMLNIRSTEEELGKPIGTDKDRNKSTLVGLMGEESVIKLINECTDNAIKAISCYDGSEFLVQLARELVERRK